MIGAPRWRVGPQRPGRRRSRSSSASSSPTGPGRDSLPRRWSTRRRRRQPRLSVGLRDGAVAGLRQLPDEQAPDSGSSSTTSTVFMTVAPLRTVGRVLPISAPMCITRSRYRHPPPTPEGPSRGEKAHSARLRQFVGRSDPRLERSVIWVAPEVWLVPLEVCLVPREVCLVPPEVCLAPLEVPLVTLDVRGVLLEV